MIETIYHHLNLLKLLAINCSGDAGFFGLPAWYRGVGKIEADGISESCNVSLNDLSDIWQIAINIIEIVTRLSAYIAVGMIIFGGFMFIFGNGEPERIASAKQTILYAVIGLVISIFATVVVGYISGLI